MKRRFYLVLIFALVSFLSSCSDSDVTPGYKKFTVRERSVVAYFTFEYPEDFKERRSYHDSAHVSVLYERSLLEEGFWDAWFYVRVGKPYFLWDYSSAANAIEAKIQPAPWLDFQILERTHAVVGNMEGELLVYSWIPGRTDDDYTYLKGRPRVMTRSIFFDHRIELY